MKKINGIYVRHDLTGQQFGKLTALLPMTRNVHERPKWECQCECGGRAFVATDKLVSGHTKSCGCLVSLTNLDGKRFGRLVALHPLPQRRGNRIVWICQCDCGNFPEITGTALVSRGTQSCGCLAKELSSERNSTHGMSKSLEYSTWRSMRKRCLDPKHLAYPQYGGRGIKVDPEWISSFENFYRDMGPIPGPDYSIDRKDNDDHYRPGNCRWADASTQQLNRRAFKNSTTGVPGVAIKDGKWVAFLTFRGKSILYKTCGTFEEALEARAAAEKEIASLIEGEDRGIVYNVDVSLEAAERKEH